MKYWFRLRIDRAQYERYIISSPPIWIFPLTQSWRCCRILLASRGREGERGWIMDILITLAGVELVCKLDPDPSENAARPDLQDSILWCHPELHLILVQLDDLVRTRSASSL